MEVDSGVLLPEARNAWSHEKMEEARKDSPRETLEGEFAADTLISDFCPRELRENTFLLL